MNLTLKELKKEYSINSSGDPWGDAMNFAFPLCEVLYSRGEHAIPDLMQFKPSPLGVCLDEDDYFLKILQEYDTNTLETFGKMLNRLMNILKVQGRDY